MVLESNKYNQSFGSMFGNNQMNPAVDNRFANQQVAYNLSQKTPMNPYQMPSIGGSSAVQNFYSDPFLLASSISPPGTTHYSSYMKNKGLVVPASSSNDQQVGLYKDYPTFIRSNVSQFKPPMEVDATNSHFNIQEFATPCIDNGDMAMGNRKSKKNNQRNGIKGHWMQGEDRMLLSLVERYGSKKWSYIARMMPGRLGKQLRERYNNHLKPGLKKEAWSEDEDMKLIEAHEKMGNKWAEISKLLPGRSESDIKNRWNATKRKCINAIAKSSGAPKPSSLFETYVKNMFRRMGQSSPISAESTVVTGSSSGGSNNQLAVTDGSGGVDYGLMDYGLQSSFDPNLLANNNGPSSQLESMTYLDMLLQ